MEVVEAGHKDYDLITFAWNIIDICQYKCSYCCAVDFNVNTYRKKSMAWKIVLSKLKRLDTPFVLEILGGEPTLHPHILEITKELNKLENCIKIELITNLAKKMSYFEKFDIPECNKLEITPSYHPEYKEGFLDKCFELKKFNNTHYCVNVNLSDDPEEWEYIKYILSKSEELKMGINFLFPAGEWKPNYTKEFFKYFKEYLDIVNKDYYPFTFSDGNTKNITTQYLIENKLNKFKGFKCKSLIYEIDLYGAITNLCTYKKQPLMPSKNSLVAEVICPQDSCDCDLWYNFHKVK
jgi:organic radical activating enzyme